MALTFNTITYVLSIRRLTDANPGTGIFSPSFQSSLILSKSYKVRVLLSISLNYRTSTKYIQNLAIES